MQDRKRQIQVRDANSRRIAERTFTKTISPDDFDDLVRRIAEAVERINIRHLTQRTECPIERIVDRRD